MLHIQTYLHVPASYTREELVQELFDCAPSSRKIMPRADVALGCVADGPDELHTLAERLDDRRPARGPILPRFFGIQFVHVFDSAKMVRTHQFSNGLLLLRSCTIAEC